MKLPITLLKDSVFAFENGYEHTSWNGFQDDYLYNVRKVNFSHIEYIDCIDLVETELWHASQSILEENTSRMDIRKD